MRGNSQFHINLSHLEFNIRQVKQLAPQKEILFMVKADGYGHGALNIVSSAFDMGVRHFGLATVREAIHVRQQLDRQLELYVFSDLELQEPSMAESYASQRLLPVIGTMLELEHFLANRQFASVPLVIKLNIGMNRLGLFESEWLHAIKLIQKSGRTSVHHLMGHLSNSANDMTADPLNGLQLQSFEQGKKLFRHAGLSIEHTSVANSGAIEQKAGLSEDFIRPGLMMYGPSAMNEPSVSAWKGKMLGILSAQVLRTFPVKKGMIIGYGGQVMERDGVIALLSLGYGDGLPSRLRGIKARLNDTPGEYVGRVNMDMAQFLMTADDARNIRTGDEVSLWSSDPQSYLDICQQAKISPYEFFCQLTSRVPRTYRPAYEGVR